MVKNTEKHHPMAAFRLQVVQPVQPVQGVPVVTRQPHAKKTRAYFNMGLQKNMLFIYIDL